jgi:ATP-binding cassette subfamily B protein
MLREYRTLVPYWRRYGGRYVAGIACLLVTNGAQLVIPQFLKSAIDTISTGDFSLDLITPTVLWIGVAAFVIGAARFGWRFFVHGASRNIEAELRHRLFSHLQRLSSTFFNKVKIGDLMARFTNDMEAIRMTNGMGLVGFVDGLFMTTVILILLFKQDVRLTLLAISPLPAVTLMMLFFGKLIGSRFRVVQEGFAGLSEMAQESISGIRVLKTFVQEHDFVEKFIKRNQEYSARHMSLIRVWGLFFPIVMFLSGLTSLIFLIVGGQSVIAGTMSPGGFTAFLAYLQMLIWPMMGAGYTISLIQRGGASLGRVNRILDEKPDIVNSLSPRTDAIQGGIAIRDLTFAFPGEVTPSLKGISLEVPAGTVLGILGKTGSGKSTLMKLLPRLLDPPPGTVYIDGRDSRSYTLHTLRSAIGMVPQDTFLFSTTIADNIRFGEKVPDEELSRLAELVTISRDLKLFPGGIETVVGERGITLSGGQKQRIALSRALAVSPQILVLDDAFSSVDTETEDTILKALVQLLEGRTTLIVSHRVSTLKIADKIIVMDGGRIIQSGDHEELISQQGLYRQIFSIQQWDDRSGRA